MTPFSWLFLGHLAGDFLFQNRWMAVNKANYWKPLLAHAFIYTVIVGLFSIPFGGIPVTGLVFIFIVHIVLDQRSFLTWWAKHITKSQETIYMILTDQVFHLIALALVIVLL